MKDFFVKGKQLGKPDKGNPTQSYIGLASLVNQAELERIESGAKNHSIF